METRPLPIHPWPNAVLPRLKVLKAEAGLPFLLQPQGAQSGVGRVLATEPPPFLCDHALVGAGNMELLDALLWVVGVKEYDARATLIADQLGNWLGGTVREVEDDLNTA